MKLIVFFRTHPLSGGLIKWAYPEPGGLTQPRVSDHVALEDAGESGGGGCVTWVGPHTVRERRGKEGRREGGRAADRQRQTGEVGREGQTRTGEELRYREGDRDIQRRTRIDNERDTQREIKR